MNDVIGVSLSTPALLRSRKAMPLVTAKNEWEDLVSEASSMASTQRCSRWNFRTCIMLSGAVMALSFTPSKSIVMEMPDWEKHMEDVFADEQGTCRLNFKEEKSIFCFDPTGVGSGMDPCLCTHLLLDAEAYAAASTRSRAGSEETISSLKLRNTHLLVLLSVDASRPPPQLLADYLPSSTDGIDVRWKINRNLDQLTPFVTNLRSLLDQESAIKKLFTLTLSGDLDSFFEQSGFGDLLQHVDFLNILTSRAVTQTFRDIDHLIKQLSNWVPTTKVLLSISLQGSIRSIVETNETENLTYSQVCSMIANENWTEEKKNDLFVTLNNRTHEIQFEDKRSIKAKADYFLEQHIGGVILWTAADDDFSGKCGDGSSPLTRKIIAQWSDTKAPFKYFRDLDIPLATGESRLIRNVHPDNHLQHIFKCQRKGFFRDPSDCTQFYHCSEYRSPKRDVDTQLQYSATLYACPRGLVYDDAHESCQWPSWSAPCKGSSELLPVPRKKFSCESRGYHVDQTDCRWFYYCSDLGDGQLEAFEFVCPSRLLGFDEQTMMCDWKWAVPACGRLDESSLVNGSVVDAIDVIQDIQNRRILDSSLLKFDIKDPSLKGNQDEELDTSDEFAPAKENYTYYGLVGRSVGDSKNIPDEIVSDERGVNLPEIAMNQKLTSLEMQSQSTPDVHASSVTDISATTSNEKLLDQTSTIPPRKFGTAYWHRSMVNTDRSLPQSRDYLKDIFPTRNNTKQDDLAPKMTNDNEAEKKLQLGKELERESDAGVPSIRTGIGRVRKLSLPRQNIQIKIPDGSNLPDYKAPKRGRHIPINNQRIRPPHYPDNSNLRKLTDDGALAHENIDPKISRHISLPQNGGPVRLGCLKNLNEAYFSDEYKKDLGCTSEATLEVQDNGDIVHSQKYVIKEDSISKISSPETGKLFQDSNKLTKLEELIQRHKDMSDSYRSSSNSETKNPVIDGRFFLLSPIDEESANDTNTRRAGKLLRTNDNDKFHNEREYYSYSNVEYKERELKNRNEDQAHEENKRENEFKLKSSNSSKLKSFNNIDKNNISSVEPAANETKSLNMKDMVMYLIKHNMTVSDIAKDELHNVTNDSMIKYPQGVLLNVDLSRINDIPPGILLEVDRMLRKFITQSNGSIDMLMKELNATSSTVTPENQTENVPNTSVATEPFTLINLTTRDPAGVTRKSTNPGIREKIIKHDENSTEPSDSKYGSDNGVTLDGQSKPFVRRRFFRKRFPSIREQLARQITERTDAPEDSKFGSLQRNTDYDEIIAPLISESYYGSRLTTEVSLPVTSSEENNQNPSDDFYLNERKHEKSSDFYHYNLEKSDGVEKTFDDVNSYKLPISPGVFRNNIAIPTQHDSSVTFDDYLSSKNTIEQLDAKRKVTRKPRNRKRLRILVKRIGQNSDDNEAKSIPDSEVPSYPEDNRNWNTNRRSSQLGEGDHSNHRVRMIYNVSIPAVNNQYSQHVKVSDQSFNKELYAVKNSERYHRSSNYEEYTYNSKSYNSRSNIQEIAGHPTVLVDRNANSPEDNQYELDSHSPVGPGKSHQDKRTRSVGFANSGPSMAIPDKACTRAGLFVHPYDCNMFYECFWDSWLQKFTIHTFSCPVRLVYDEKIRGCDRPGFLLSCKNSIER